VGLQHVVDRVGRVEPKRRRNLAELQVEVHERDARVRQLRKQQRDVRGVESLAAAAGRRRNREYLAELTRAGLRLDDDLRPGDGEEAFLRELERTLDRAFDRRVVAGELDHVVGADL